MGQVIVLGLRVLQLCAAVTNLVLVALGKMLLLVSVFVHRRLTRTVINWYLLRTSVAPPSSFTFLTFAPIFSILSIAYLTLAPRFIPRYTNPFVSLAVEFLNTIFYFAGFIALAVFLSKLLFCNGTVCAVGRSTSIVAAAEFSCWIATMMIEAKTIFKKGLRGRDERELMRERGPIGVERGPFYQERVSQVGRAV